MEAPYVMLAAARKKACNIRNMRFEKKIIFALASIDNDFYYISVEKRHRLIFCLTASLKNLYWIFFIKSIFTNWLTDLTMFISFS